MVVDFMLNPLSALQAGPTGEVVKTARVPVGTISLRADNCDLINQGISGFYTCAPVHLHPERSAYLADVIVKLAGSDDDFGSF